MNVIFRNGYPYRVYIMIAFYDPNGCRDYGNWATAGWYVIDPGNEGWIFSTFCPFAFYYAEALDGAVWAGEYTASFYYTPFNSCIGIGTSDGEVGMRRIDLGPFWFLPYAFHTFTLL